MKYKKIHIVEILQKKENMSNDKIKKLYIKFINALVYL